MNEIQDCLFGTDMVLVIRIIELASKGELELAEANVQKCKVRHLGMVENE